MSHYANELQEATCLLNTSDFDEILIDIKNEVSNDKWSGYGWKENVLRKETLFEVADIFDIKLLSTHGHYVRPEIKNVYVSAFFKTLIRIIAPYMSNGKIKIDDEYGVVTITFKNGVSTIKRKDF